MTFKIRSDARYRMPVSFGPIPGPRQHPEGRPWTVEETGTMNGQWMKVNYRTDPEALERLLPPGFSLRGDPIVSVSCGWFKNLYWLAGRGYGILTLDFPVTYQGRDERIDGAYCPVLWEGQPEAITTGREELGFPKLNADVAEIDFDEANGRATCEASWFDHKFFDIALTDLVENNDAPAPQAVRGVPLYYKYMPRTGPDGVAGTDVAYVTTAAPPPGVAPPVPTDFHSFRKWTGKGVVAWNRATFEQLPLSFHIVNGIADLPILEWQGAEMHIFSRPGIGASVSTLRVVEP